MAYRYIEHPYLYVMVLEGINVNTNRKKSMAAGMFQGLQDSAALKKRFERFGAVFFVAKVPIRGID